MENVTRTWIEMEKRELNDKYELEKQKEREKKLINVEKKNRTKEKRKW